MIAKLRATLLGAASAAALVAFAPGQAAAQVASFHIPAAPLSAALNAYAKAANRQIIFSSEAVQPFRAGPLDGAFTPDEALARLLQGTGLVVTKTPSGVLVVSSRPARMIRAAAREIVQAPPALPPAAPAVAAPEEAVLGEIVVTARRRAESLQEVPQTVSAVTADTLSKLNITQFQDVQNVVPGLSLQEAGNGYASTASLRGVTFDVNTGAPLGTVAMYMNDAPVQPLMLFDSLFDVGQIEVLRGPQGTTRGVSAPSGAITVTTHKPALSEMGGYIDATVTDLQGRNVQGAINIPLIKDVLAVRAAAVMDQTDFGGVRSIHDNLRPSQKIAAERVSVSFEPSDLLNANLAYQHIDRRAQGFDQVSGPGRGTFIDPAISPGERVAVEDGISDTRAHLDIVTAQVDSRIFGQHLSYVGSYQHQHIHARNIGTGGDMGDILPGIELYNYQNVATEWTTQELRLASDPAPGRFFDYTVGAYYNWQGVTGSTVQPGPLLLGAFGPPSGGINLADFNPKYQIPIGIDIPSSNQETSLFGSVTLHLGANTELSGGMRHIWSVVNNNTIISTGNGLVALPAAALGGSCGARPVTYAGFCDVTLPTGRVTGNFHNRTSETPNIYNVSLSHHFTRDLMVYVNTGTAYRPPFASVGISGPLAGATEPDLQSLNFHPSERSRAYELGFKATFLDGRARFNADVFRQRFHNLSIYIPGINYVNAQGLTQFAFTQSVDALVQGFEIDSALQVTRDWNIALQASYSDGKVQGSLVPCNTYGPDGVTPVFNRAVNGASVISLCPGGSASRLPYWNATLTSEYSHPVNDTMDGFVRGLLNYYPQNKNRAEPDFTVAAYSLLNLYAGVRSHDGAWEVSVFAKNAFATDRALDVSPAPLALNNLLATPSIGFAGRFPTASGYFATTVTPQREVGVNVHYAWGSR